MPNMTRQQLRDHFQKERQAQGFDDGVVLADALFLELAGIGESDRRRIDEDLLNPNRLYAIKDSDLQLGSELIGAAVAAFPKLSPAALGKLASLLLKYWRKRVEITPLQAAMLRTMQTERDRDWRSDELRTAVGLGWGPVHEPLDGELAILQGHGFVTKNGDAWRITDV